jgi:hypothetical protein
MKTKIIGLVLLVVGAALIYWGYVESEAIGSKIAKTFTGSDSDNVMFKYIGGAVSVVAGGFLVFKK